MNIGSMDQLFEAIRDITTACKKYYDECIAKGFTPDQALLLAIDFQRTIMTPNK